MFSFDWNLPSEIERPSIDILKMLDFHRDNTVAENGHAVPQTNLTASQLARLDADATPLEVEFIRPIATRCRCEAQYLSDLHAMYHRYEPPTIKSAIGKQRVKRRLTAKQIERQIAEAQEMHAASAEHKAAVRRGRAALKAQKAAQMMQREFA